MKNIDKMSVSGKCKYVKMGDFIDISNLNHGDIIDNGCGSRYSGILFVYKQNNVFRLYKNKGDHESDFKVPVSISEHLEDPLLFYSDYTYLTMSLDERLEKKYEKHREYFNEKNELYVEEPELLLKEKIEYNVYKSISAKDLNIFFFDNNCYGENDNLQRVPDCMFLLTDAFDSSVESGEVMNTYCLYKNVSIEWIAKSIHENMKNERDEHGNFSGFDEHKEKYGIVIVEWYTKMQAAIHDRSGLERRNYGFYIDYILYAIERSIPKKDWFDSKVQKEYMERIKNSETVPLDFNLYRENDKEFFVSEYYDEIFALFKEFNPDAIV